MTNSKPPECNGCPYYNTGLEFVKPEGPLRYEKGICGEAPGQEEASRGRPFIGASGWHLRKAITTAGLASQECSCGTGSATAQAEGAKGECGNCLGLGRLSSETLAIYNTINCRPPHNDYSTVGRNAVAYCQSKHWPIPSDEAVTLLVGAKALTAYYPQLDWPGALERWRGSLIPHPDGKGWCIPTYHPAFALRGKRYILPVIQQDVLGLASNFDKRRLLPTIVDSVGKGEYVSVDIETNRETGDITLIGVSTDGEHVAQFDSMGLAKDWFDSVGNHSNYAFAHNSKFDSQKLNSVGIVVAGKDTKSTLIDTMLAFRMYQSDSKSVNLGAAVATTLPGQQLYWKSLVGDERDKGFTRAMWSKVNPMAAYYDEEAWFRFYNALDVMMTWRLGVRLKEILERG